MFPGYSPVEGWTSRKVTAGVVMLVWMIATAVFNTIVLATRPQLSSEPVFKALIFMTVSKCVMIARIIFSLGVAVEFRDQLCVRRVLTNELLVLATMITDMVLLVVFYNKDRTPEDELLRVILSLMLIDSVVLPVTWVGIMSVQFCVTRRPSSMERV